MGSQAHKERLSLIFNELGYDMVLCTVRSDNEPQKRLLRKNNWEFLTLFTSSKTDNKVELWARYKDN